MNFDRTKLVESLHRHIRKAANLRKIHLKIGGLNSFQNVISILQGVERLSWVELDDFIIQRFQFQPWSTHNYWTFWEYGILLKLWLLSSDKPLSLACYDDNGYAPIGVVLDILFNYHNRASQRALTVHALPGRIHSNKALVMAIAEESAEKVKFLTDLMPDPVQARRHAYGYALNHGKTDFFYKLFQIFGTESDIVALKESLLHYWLEIVAARKIDKYFGEKPSENGCWNFFLNLAKTHPETLEAIQGILAKVGLAAESFVQGLIHAGIIEDIKLMPEEPNLDWFTYRTRAKFFVEYAEDFRAVLAPDDPILNNITLADTFMRKEGK